jgi:hypothetical protein
MPSRGELIKAGKERAKLIREQCLEINTLCKMFDLPYAVQFSSCLRRKKEREYPFNVYRTRLTTYAKSITLYEVEGFNRDFRTHEDARAFIDGEIAKNIT